jgi:hypothetical protein
MVTGDGQALPSIVLLDRSLEGKAHCQLAQTSRYVWPLAAA